MEDILPDKFTVSFGQLSPQGMRQRYLLGRYGKQRYVDIFGALNQNDYSPKNNQIYVQSTDFYRTIQSAYAQILGFLHSEIVEELTTKSAANNN